MRVLADHWATVKTVPRLILITSRNRSAGIAFFLHHGLSFILRQEIHHRGIWSTDETNAIESLLFDYA
jgi:hypothetical protein